MTVKIDRKTYENQQVVTNDMYSPESFSVVATAGTIPMGTVMSLKADRTLEIADDTDTQLLILKEDLELVASGDVHGGFLAMGECNREFVIYDDGAVTDAVENKLNETGIYLVSGI